MGIGFEIVTAIGRQLRVECGVPQELPQELSTLLNRRGGKEDPYADIVGTC
jgi:hypothetical protein